MTGTPAGGGPAPRHRAATLKRLRPMVAPLSPRHRRWKRFLASLPLDPERLTPPLEAPSPHDFIICGSPRTGTTLLTAALFQPPAVVTVMEPWDGMRHPPAVLFDSLRTEIDTTGGLRRGRLDVESLLADGVVRWSQEGQVAVELDVASDYRLGVKWPAYWRYLELLPETKFLVCIRHPFEVITSFELAGGRVAEGLQYDTVFNRDLNRDLLNAASDVEVRRVLLYDYVNERLLPSLSRPNVFVVRYERWFEDPLALLAEIGDFLGTQLVPPPVQVRRPRSRPTERARDLDVIRRHCRTAESLGYRLDDYCDTGAAL